MTECVTPKDVVNLLNELIKLDRAAIERLVNKRAVCNLNIAHHKTVQVHTTLDGTAHYVGLLGILNGLFNTLEDGFGQITLVYENTRLIKAVLTTEYREKEL